MTHENRKDRYVTWVFYIFMLIIQCAGNWFMSYQIGEIRNQIRQLESRCDRAGVPLSEGAKENG